MCTSLKWAFEEAHPSPSEGRSCNYAEIILCLLGTFAIVTFLCFFPPFILTSPESTGPYACPWLAPSLFPFFPFSLFPSPFPLWVYLLHPSHLNDGEMGCSSKEGLGASCTHRIQPRAFTSYLMAAHILVDNNLDNLKKFIPGYRC